MDFKRTAYYISAICTLIFGIVSCSSDEEKVFGLDTFGILANQLENVAVEEGGIVAYAYSDENTNHEDVYVLFYPEEGAVNIRFYETNSLDVDETNYENYQQAIFLRQRVFNGLFEQILHQNSAEKWMIITYEFNNVTKISNPIRIKNQQQPTIWETEGVTIDQSTTGAPIFTWEENIATSDEIYLQVLSQEGNVLSATHTTENQFKFYDTSNVFLNLTEGTPPNLVQGETYYINVLEIGQDHWINRLWVVPFEAE